MLLLGLFYFYIVYWFYILQLFINFHDVLIDSADTSSPVPSWCRAMCRQCKWQTNIHMKNVWLEICRFFVFFVTKFELMKPVIIHTILLNKITLNICTRPPHQFHADQPSDQPICRKCFHLMTSSCIMFEESAITKADNVELLCFVFCKPE